MTLYNTLGRDPFDPQKLAIQYRDILVPGPNFATNPRDYRKERLAYIDPAALRKLSFDLLNAFKAAGSPAPAASTDDTTYQWVYTREVSGTDTLFAGNPDDPLNPETLVIGATGTALVDWYDDGGSLVASRAAAQITGDATVTDDAGNSRVVIDVTGGGGGGTVTEAYKTIHVTGQTDVAADSATDTLEFAEGDYVTITLADASGAPAYDTITIGWNYAGITGYHASDFKVLTLVTGTPTWGGYAEGTGIDITGNTISCTLLDTSSGAAGSLQFGLLIADVPACTINYDATLSYIEHGYSEDAVIPLQRNLLAGGDGGDQLQAVQSGGSQVVLPAVNPIWTNIIKAGTTTDADKPVICQGRRETWSIFTDPAVEEVEVFVLANIFYPVTIMKCLTNGAVATSDTTFPVDNLELLWGRDPEISSIASVANPDEWDADDNAYCLIMQKTDGTWQAIDLECPA